MFRILLSLLVLVSVCPSLILATPAQTSRNSNLREREEMFRVFVDVLTNRATTYKAGVHGLSVLEKQGILDQHNTLRGSVTPAAGNMRYLTWDETLASHAGDWAEQCNWWHETTDGEGQNLWLGFSITDGVQPVKSWYHNEKNHYNYDLNACFEDEVCGHYFQVAWAKASKVGCARAFCPEVTRKNVIDLKNFWIFNCHYDVSVYKGSRPYIEDEPCSVCSEDYRKCMAGSLCRKPSQCGRDNIANCHCRLGHCGIGFRNDEDCLCDCCEPGYWQSTCTPCLDNSTNCGKGKIYPDSRYCRFPAVAKVCPVMCGECASWECVRCTDQYF